MKKLGRVLLVLMCLCSSKAFALEEYVSDVYHDIDAAFQQKSESGLNIVLQENQGDRYYYLMENYATKKVRRLIITNDYEFAMTAILVIIDNNLDNTDAVEMYSMISDAFAEQQAAELEAQIERERQLARLEEEKQNQRSKVEKTYSTVETASGKKVSQEKDMKLSANAWKFRFGFIDGDVIMNQSDNFMDFKYGVSAAYDFERQTNTLDFGVDAYGAFHFSFLQPDKDNSLLGNLELQGKVSFVNFWDRFFLRGGLVALPTVKAKKSATAEIFDSFITPSVGIGIMNASMGESSFTLTADYYPGHLFYKNKGLNAAAGIGMNLGFPYANLDRVKLTFNLGLKDYIYIKNTGLENRAKIIIAIGAENVIR